MFQDASRPVVSEMRVLSDLMQLPLNLLVAIILFPSLLLDQVAGLLRGLCCLAAMLFYSGIGGNLKSTIKFVAVSKLPELAQSKLPKSIANGVASVKS